MAWPGCAPVALVGQALSVPRGGQEAGRPGYNPPLQLPLLIYDAFSSEQTHFQTPLRDINYPKGLICITVVGQCRTRKHSRLSAISIQGELWVFFPPLLSTSERGLKTFNRFRF